MLQFNFNVFNEFGTEIKITVRDSMRIYNDKLKNLPKMFLAEEEQKKIYKELFPYSYYTKQRYISNKGSIEEAVKNINKQPEHSEETF